nr:hypothetical protein [Tanacetum cinerariifolium]
MSSGTATIRLFCMINKGLVFGKRKRSIRLLQERVAILNGDRRWKKMLEHLIRIKDIIFNFRIRDIEVKMIPLMHNKVSLRRRLGFLDKKRRDLDGGKNSLMNLETRSSQVRIERRGYFERLWLRRFGLDVDGLGGDSTGRLEEERVVLTVSAQRGMGNNESASIVLAASVSVQFFLSATLFYCGVMATLISLLIPFIPQN